jgi:hypothetical protein
MKSRFDYEKVGALGVYLRLLTSGIRDICIQDYGEATKEATNYIDEAAKKLGFCTMLVTHNRIAPDGTRFKSYQRIIYRKHKRADARELRRRFQKSPKERNDHIAIGRLLGYSKKAIEAFVS